MLGFTALGCVLLPCTLWAAAALYFDVRVPWLRAPLAVAYLAALLAVWILVKGRWRKLGLTAGGFLLVLAWWLTLQPSNNRDWQPDLAVLAYADIDGNKVTVHNIRNCDYRTETDFDVRHYDKTFDLDQPPHGGSLHGLLGLAVYGAHDGEFRLRRRRLPLLLH